MRAELDMAASTIIGGIPEGADEFETVVYFHDEIVRGCEFSTEKEHVNSAYGDTLDMYVELDPGAMITLSESGGITVKEFKHIPGVNDAEYIRLLEEYRKIDRDIINKAVAKIKRLSAELKEQKKSATVTIGRTRGETTMWYECDACGEPVDLKDNYCSNCGRKLIHD